MSESEQSSVAPDGRPPEEQPAWRGDFPIDWPQDDYVVRRDFTKFMVLTSLAFVVGQFFIGIQSWWRRRRGRPAPRRIAPLDQVPVGGVLPFHYPDDDTPCLLLRPEFDTLLAYDQNCTHLSCGVVPEMAAQPSECRLRCPCHHGLFDLTTGRPLAGPPRRPLSRIELEVRADGTIWATGIEERTV
jgi:nitrite reductase/ring-hydroxylating ferredoxin subunit